MTLMSDGFHHEQEASQVVSALHRTARGAAVIAILMGGIGLLAGTIALPILNNFRSLLATVEAYNALGFVLAGVSLWFREAEVPSPRTRRFADFCAFAVFLIGLFTFLQYGFHQDFGLDRLWLHRTPLLPGTLYSDRMATTNAALFGALGVALLLLDKENRQGHRPAQLLLLPIGLFALASLLGYFYNILAPKEGAPYSPILWPSALIFSLLSLGALCARPNSGVLRVVTTDAVGRDVARRLLPAAVVIPPLLCILCYLGYRLDLYEVAFGLAVLTTLNGAVFTTLIWRTAGALNQADVERQRTEMQRNELHEALQQAHAFREQVIDSAVFAVIALDREGRFTLVNRRMTEITGYSLEELLGKPFTMLSPDDAREFMREQFQHTLQEAVSVDYVETQLLRKNGSLVTVAFGWSALCSDNKVIGMVGTGEDITDRKRLEEQLFQARKLESIGRLAGGVAHDFNNLLTAILGYSELLKIEIPNDSSVTGYVHNIHKAAERAASLTKQLLTFARRQVVAPKNLDLNDLILNLNTMLQRLIGEHIELVMLPASDLHAVCIDPTQFEQILINLIVNARDAIPLQGGQITVETSNTILDAEYARHHEGVIPGDYVLLAVSDTGSGMDESVRLQIFEPFFTTKAQGRGTGLGLATVYGIVKQAGGHIWLYSEVEKGTTFKIYLPRAAESVTENVTIQAPLAPLRGTETLLVVEDEDAVRTLTTAALRGLGYHVLEAADGMTALQIVERYPGRIDLLITDVVMPQMSGKELAERLLVLCPTLKVLYVSGYTENTIVHHGVLEPGILFLAKPFTLSALSLKVKEILNTLNHSTNR